MSTPAIDYTDKDFASLRAALLRLAGQRLPEWTDRSPSDLVMLLIDLFAYCGDIVAYYQDRIASELFPATATERGSIVDLLRLIGYELTPVTPARVDLRLSFARPSRPEDPRSAQVPRGARFRAEVPGDGPIEFVYLGPDLTFDLTSSEVRPDPEQPVVHYDRLPVEQGRPISPAAIVIGSGTDEPNLSLPLPDRQVNLDSVVVEVHEGADWVRWERVVDDEPTSDPLAREYRLIVDATDTPRVLFTNRRPPVAVDNIRAAYRGCLGARGNVAAGSITEAITAIPALASVTNPDPAAGGSDAESARSAIENAPLVFRSMRRAVTAGDYAALARRTGTVAKVRVRSPVWNRVELYVAPIGTTLRPLPESLRNHLLAFFEDKRPVGTVIQVFGARPAPIDIGVEVIVDDRFVPSTVAANVRTAITDLLAFARVDFAQTLYLSDVYAVVEAVSGVVAATIDRFRRADRPAVDVASELVRLGLPPLSELPDFLRAAVSADVAVGGRIEVGEFEIPTPGTLDVRVGAR
ncbi:hypothetical protein ALI22I_01205 [Saccharothrix sp. ALI-22-I]|uniref:baseplate J/gp47 family protein n=1 Tax=Saccharothrix sp. ALI-22-I TaxID=1933778 RepID=UPI00097CAD6F|nr:baseplate J/gp47 family protein [Saccharothrix sp. ALI-22-I]ONI92921.1 hypothetical protein ALI22I_01205 [Saccharothrix sp. ALI-22-I]